jgi:WD40 repeat protein
LFDHTHRRLITGAHDGSIKLWNFSTGVQLKELAGFGEGSEVTGLACIQMTPYNYILATGWNRKVTMWLDPQSMPEQKGAVLPTQQHQTHWSSVKEDLLCMACYPDINLLATGAYDGDIIIWNPDTGTPRTHLVLPGLSSLKTEHKPIEAMQLVGIRGKSTCFRQTNLPENATLELTSEQKTANMSHKFPPKSKKSANLVVLLFTASGDGLIRIWSTDDTAELLLGMFLALARSISQCLCPPLSHFSRSRTLGYFALLSLLHSPPCFNTPPVIIRHFLFEYAQVSHDTIF